MRCILVAVMSTLAVGCDDVPASQDALPSCWDSTCPGDPDATECGSCVHPGMDLECPPGFVCSCRAICVKGPRGYDGGSCVPDAGLGDPMGPDASLFEWPVCDQSHRPQDDL